MILFPAIHTLERTPLLDLELRTYTNTANQSCWRSDPEQRSPELECEGEEITNRAHAVDTSPRLAPELTDRHQFLVPGTEMQSAMATTLTALMRFSPRKLRARASSRRLSCAPHF